MSTGGPAISSLSFNNSVGNMPEPAAVERRCENADCNATKLISIVPKRKTQQFVTDPNVMEKPTLINGFTTIFQVDGNSAKLSDLKNVPNSNPTNQKMIYRIVPNTHAHIVNYVVVDADGESLRKINENDPATMRKLLESQKVSAEQMLKKLIGGSQPTGGALNNLTGVDGVNAVSIPVGGLGGGSNTTTAGIGVAGRGEGTANDNGGINVHIGGFGAISGLNASATNSVLPTINNSTKLPTKPMNTSPNKSIRSTTKSTTRSTMKTANKSTNVGLPPKILPTVSKLPSSSSSSSMTTPVSLAPSLPLVQTIPPSSSTSLPSSPSSSSQQIANISNAQIQLPLRMHPNLKITAVASAANTMPPFKSLPSKSTPTATLSQTSSSLKTAITTTSSSSNNTGPTVPLITPVPLSALQCPSPLPPVLTATPTVASLSSTSSSLPVLMPQHSNIGTLVVPSQQIPTTATVVDKPVFDKMQAELQELRRTVALLAEAHAKNNLPQQQQERIQQIQQQLPQQNQLQQQQQQQATPQVVPVQLKSAVPSKPAIPKAIVAKSVTGGPSIWGGKRLRQT